MKLVITFLLFVSLGYGGAEWPIKPQNELEENLLAFFDMWLKEDTKTLLPLPPLNEILIPKLEGTYKENGIKLSYSTSDMKLTGLPQSYIRELVATASPQSLAARAVLVAPSLTLFAEKYKMDGRAFYIYTIKGEGKMRTNFQNSILVVDIELGTNGKQMWVEKLQFGVEVDNITIDLTGTTNFIKNMLNNKASSTFEKHRNAMETSLTETVVPLLNSYLGDISPAQLLQILSSVRRNNAAAVSNYLS